MSNFAACGHLHCRSKRSAARTHPEDVNLDRDKLFGEYGKTFKFALRRSKFDRGVLSFNIPKLLQALYQRPQIWALRQVAAGRLAPSKPSRYVFPGGWASAPVMLVTMSARARIAFLLIRSR